MRRPTTTWVSCCTRNGDSAGTCRFAQSRLDGSEVVLGIPQGFSPTRVRYCWADNPVCTLYDRSGLPVGPFEVQIDAQQHAKVGAPAAGVD